MRKVEISINGKALPCRQTMGAVLRFKQETGKEVTEIGKDDLSDNITFLWCCIVSACKHDGIEFNMSLMDFADSITAEDMTAWTEQAQNEIDAVADPESEGEKKSN